MNSTVAPSTTNIVATVNTDTSTIPLCRHKERMVSRNPYCRYLNKINFIIFQNYRLLGDRTAFENVAFAVEVLGATRREVERKVDYALHLVGLDDRKTHFPCPTGSY